MSKIEEFSVRELADFRRYSEQRNTEELEDLVATNLAISGIRGYELEPDYKEMNSDQALSLLIHDSAVDAYKLNSELDVDEFYEFLAGSMKEEAEQAKGLDTDILLEREVYGRPLSEVVQDISEYYAKNFSKGSEVEIEEVMENNGFFGRADIIRKAGGDTELRDVKNRYSRNIPVPGPDDGFKMGSYALISREQRDIDRFVLEYPIQGIEVEVGPEEWFGEVVQKADEFEKLLEKSRNRQAQLLEDAMGLENGKDPRTFVEDLNLGYSTSRDFAEPAVTEGLELNR